MGQEVGCCERKPNIDDEILMEANVKELNYLEN